MTAVQEQLIPDPPATPVPTTEHSMVEMLRRHYVPDATKTAGVFAPEIQAPGPVQRRADLIWLGCTAAAGNRLVGHEVKVTRADVLSELADLTKSDPWQRYCDQWWLVIPHLSLIEGLELPESWGVVLPPSGRRTRSVTVHRKAPLLGPVEDMITALKDLGTVSERRAQAQFELDSCCRSLQSMRRQIDRFLTDKPWV